jgi:hypothetical protein
MQPGKVRKYRRNHTTKSNTDFPHAYVYGHKILPIIQGVKYRGLRFPCAFLICMSIGETAGKDIICFGFLIIRSCVPDRIESADSSICSVDDECL